MSIAQDNRQARSTAAQQAETAKARTASTVVGAAVTAATALITALPTPAKEAVQALTTAVYAFLSAKPMTINTALVPDTPKQSIDPVFLFAVGIAFAIIEALWCFIKALLHPLPIIGMFFPLCDDDTRAGPNGALIENSDKTAKNAADGAAQALITQIGSQITPPDLPLPKVPSPVRSSPVGITFSEFAATSAAATTAASAAAALAAAALVASGSHPTSANIPVPAPTPYTYEEGNLSSEQARRLFGL